MAEEFPHCEGIIPEGYVVARCEDYARTEEEVVESLVKELRIAVRRSLRKVTVPEGDYYHANIHFLVPKGTAKPWPLDLQKYIRAGAVTYLNITSERNHGI
jgi:hypothetical protein